MVNSKIAFRNLRAELSRSQLTIEAIAKFLRLTRTTVGFKFSRKYPITLSEAFAIKKEFFPGLDVEYLFEELFIENDTPRQSEEMQAVNET